MATELTGTPGAGAFHRETAVSQDETMRGRRSYRLKPYSLSFRQSVVRLMPRASAVRE